MNRNPQIDVYVTALKSLNMHFILCAVYNALLDTLLIVFLGYYFLPPLFFVSFLPVFIAIYNCFNYVSHIAHHLDTRYNGEEQLTSIHLLIQQNRHHPFFSQILKNAQFIVLQNSFQEKKRVLRPSLIRTFIVTVWIVIFSINQKYEVISFFSPKNISVQEKRILRAASMEAEKIMKKWEAFEVDEEKKEQWREIIKQLPKKNKRQLTSELNKLSKNIPNLKNMKRSREQKIREIEDLLKKPTSEISEQLLEKIQIQKEKDLAIKIYDDWVSEKKRRLLKKTKDFIRNLHEKLKVSPLDNKVQGNSDGSMMTSTSSNFDENLVDVLDLKDSAAISDKQGWIKESLPEKYRDIVSSYWESEKSEKK